MRIVTNFCTGVQKGPWRNHLCQLLWLSLMGFERGGGSNFGFLHWLASSPLQHSRTTVRVCDPEKIIPVSYSYTINVNSPVTILETEITSQTRWNQMFRCLQWPCVMKRLARSMSRRRHDADYHRSHNSSSRDDAVEAMIHVSDVIYWHRHRRFYLRTNYSIEQLLLSTGDHWRRP